MKEWVEEVTGARAILENHSQKLLSTGRVLEFKYFRKKLNVLKEGTKCLNQSVIISVNQTLSS